MGLMQYLGLSPFPYLAVAVGGLIGLVGGVGARFVFWGNGPGGTVVAIRLGFWGILTGAFLALCYHMVNGVCRLGLAN
jgi:hypothetical protein